MWLGRATIAGGSKWCGCFLGGCYFLDFKVFEILFLDFKIFKIWFLDFNL
jgi:hypothetical protein